MIDEIPRLGFGTWGRTGDQGTEAILFALEIGYRHLDTAQSYNTEAQVGQAIARSGLPRDEIFVTTKIRPENFGPGKLVDSLRRSCETIGVDRVDLTLIHWPSPYGKIAPDIYLRQLAEARGHGLTRLIGVSNFTIPLLEAVRDILGAGEIATNQIELNPLFQNRKVAEYCCRNGIIVTCYQPVAQGRMNGMPAMERIAEAHGANVEQVALAYELAKGYAAIPTSSKRDRILSNWRAQELRLSKADIASIDGLPQAVRAIDPAGGPTWD